MAKFESLLGKITFVIGVAMTLFHIVALVFYPLPASVFRTIHLMFVLLLIFLRMPKPGEWKGAFLGNAVFIILSIAAVGYAFFELENILTRGGIWTTNTDIVLGFVAILVVLEAARRSNGLALPLIAVFFILYALFGNHIPGMLGHKGYSIKRIITTLYTYEGIFGTALATAATFVSMFIIFGEVLDTTGAGNVFLELSKSVAGGLRGGPAKIGVIACALFGTISGSAVACVAATGAIIVPLMIKMKYDKVFAAAAISSAAIGGQIMPPVMAAGAFLMAEFLGVPYFEIMKAATIPALMYFLTIWISIDSNAGKMGLVGLSRDEMPRFSSVFKKDWPLLLPVVLLIVLLVVFKYSAIMCAFYAIVAGFVVCMIDSRRRLSLKEILNTMAAAAKGIAPTACACACAGIVIGVIGLTGLGLKISTIIISFSGGYVLLALILSMVTAILFGMGLPTTVSYLLCVAVLSPALINMGVLPMAAHMFIFYFACLSGITPPVALAAYTASGIAGTSPLKTASEGTKLAVIAFFVPYMFVFNKAFLMQGSILEILWASAVGIATCFAIAGFMQGWLVMRLNLLMRAAFLFISAFLMIQHKVLDVVGLASFAAAVFFLKLKANKERRISSKEGVDDEL